MKSIPLGTYQSRKSLLHGIPAGPKLGLLILYSILVVALRGPWSALGALGFSIVLAAIAHLRLVTVLRGLRPIIAIVVILGAFQWWQGGWQVAVEIAGTILALVVAASVFTASTPMDEMLDAIVRGLRPFRRVGVDPEKVALAFSLMIGAIPRILEISTETRDAARARGLERSPRAYLIPMAVRTVAHAQETGEALAARGIGDD